MIVFFFGACTSNALILKLHKNKCPKPPSPPTGAAPAAGCSDGALVTDDDDDEEADLDPEADLDAVPATNYPPVA